ncbi:MAG: MFS transporter [Bacillota bacterium]
MSAIPGYRRVLANRSFSLLLSGQTVSWFGDAVYFIALLWLVQDLTGSKVLMGLVAAGRTVPSLFGIVAGALIDRYDRRRMMIAADLTRAALVIAVPVLWMTHNLRSWHLPAIAFLLGLASVFFVPARRALLPSIVDPDDLVSANSLMNLSMQIVAAAGFAAGGVLIGVWGMMPLFVFDAASFVVSALAIWVMPVPHQAAQSPLGTGQAPARPAAKTRSKLVDEIMVGLRYIRGNGVLSRVLPLSLAMNFVIAPIFVLMPSWVHDILHAGARTYGFLQTAEVIGAVVGTVAVVPLAKRVRRPLLVFGVLALQGLTLFALALGRSETAAMAALTAFGLMDAMVNVVLWAYLQEIIPGQMMGRIFGSIEAITQVLSPTGQALAGIVGEFVALPVIFLTVAGLRLAGALSGWVVPGLMKELDAAAESPPPAAARVAAEGR